LNMNILLELKKKLLLFLYGFHEVIII